MSLPPLSVYLESGFVDHKMSLAPLPVYLDSGAVDPRDDLEGFGAAEGGVLIVVGAWPFVLVGVGHHFVQQEPRDVQQHHQHDNHADLHLETTGVMN